MVAEVSNAETVFCKPSFKMITLQLLEVPKVGFNNCTGCIPTAISYTVLAVSERASYWVIGTIVVALNMILFV